ncbi:MAG: hypothetical protein H8E66_00180, partial [Planctomycetes bacterium]|nr:hypothetical protein [Planctomycetota bacterium]
MSLWSLAADQFAQGITELGEIEDQIAKTPDLERKLSETPTIAMRLDAARVRQAAIAQREQLARDAERSRLNELRAIAKSYRDLLAKMAEADLYLRLEDYPRVRQANVEVLEDISKVFELARSRKDYHLFDDEPQLDAGADFKVIQSSPLPLNVNLIAHVKAIQSLATCRLALSGNSVDSELLKEASSWANAALNGDPVTSVKLPDGHDSDNPIGHYVLGLVNESFGFVTTRPNPADPELHRQAAPLFAEARKQYEQVATLILEKHPNSAAITELATEVANRIQALDTADSALVQADKATTAGRPEDAWVVLQEAAVRHRDQRVWLAMVEAGRRGGVSRDDLTQAILVAVQQKVLSDGDARSQIVLMKAAIDAVWNEVGRQGAAKLSSDRREQLRSILLRQSDLLRTAVSAEGNEIVHAQADAFLALAIAYQTILSESTSGQSDALREAHRLARDSMAAIEPAVATEKDEMLAIALREALIASRLAYGHISIQVLPDYRDDALLAFAAAFDEMAKLPFRKGDVSILGSPMISAMAARGGESGTKLAFEERRYRELVTRFLEGMYTLQFGNASAAADQMATALRLGQQSGGGPGRTGARDAAVMLGQTDGFDAQVTLNDSVKAFKILADIKAARYELALLECIRLLNPGTSVKTANDANESVLDDAIGRIQSPLVGFAFASAIEGYVSSLELPEGSRQEMLLVKAAKAFDRVDQQLQSRRMQSRYPHLAALVGDARQRLGSIDTYRDDAIQFRSRGDLKGAIDALLSGLNRHPRSDVLWRLYLETQIEQARRGDTSEELYDQILDRVAQATRMNMITRYQQNYFNAVLYERLGK